MKIRLKNLICADTNQIIFQLYLRSPQLEEMLWGVDFNAFEEDVNWYPSQLIGVKISLPSLMV